MDRNLVYPGSIPLDTDILQTNRNVQAAIGFLASMVVGTGPVCDGLAFSPTQPASLTINIGPGSYTVASQVDQLAYGSLSPDASPLVKMGINLAATQFTLTAPSVPGQSINYIIEATLQENDANPVVLPYLNAANPAQTFAGPSNSGTAQNTLRIQRVGLQLKAGAAANTGTQLTPAVDIGWTAIYIITVNFGQTQITAPNVTIAPGAPFVRPKLGPLGAQLRTKLQADLTLYVSPSGNDVAGNGSQLAPFANMQAAWNLIINSYDLNGHNVLVNVADGTYTAPLAAGGSPIGLGSGNLIQFKGNINSPTNCLISTTNANAISAGGYANICIAGFSIQASGAAPFVADASGVVASSGGISITGPMNYGTCSGQQIWATSGGQIGLNNQSYTISGNAKAHLQSSAGSLINFVGCAATLNGTPAFSVAFASAVLDSAIQMINTTYTGAATGTRYIANLNGAFAVLGAGPNLFPGNAVGVTGTGGQYA